MDKTSIRKTMKQKRLLYDKQTLLSYSDNILQQVLTHPYYKEAKTIGIYVSLPKEVNTIPLILQSLKEKTVCVPKCEGDIMHFYEIKQLEDLKEGHFHVLEPQTSIKINPEDIDVIIVPMLAYDQRKYRVGYGKGYYDKYLQSGFKGKTIGLSYHFQYVDHIDINQYDIALDDIIINATL